MCRGQEARAAVLLKPPRSDGVHSDAVAQLARFANTARAAFLARAAFSLALTFSTRTRPLLERGSGMGLGLGVASGALSDTGAFEAATAPLAGVPAGGRYAFFGFLAMTVK